MLRQSYLAAKNEWGGSLSALLLRLQAGCVLLSQEVGSRKSAKPFADLVPQERMKKSSTSRHGILRDSPVSLQALTTTTTTARNELPKSRVIRMPVKMLAEQMAWLHQSVCAPGPSPRLIAFPWPEAPSIPSVIRGHCVLWLE